MYHVEGSGEKMTAGYGFIKKSELSPGEMESDVYAECRSKGLNLCDIDEICQIRLANALGKDLKEIDASIDYAIKKGLINVRQIKSRGKRPSTFIKITYQGRMFFGTMKKMEETEGTEG